MCRPDLPKISQFQPVYDQLDFIKNYTGNNICIPYAERTNRPTVTRRFRPFKKVTLLQNSKSYYLYIVLACTLLIISGVLIWSVKNKNNIPVSLF